MMMTVEDWIERLVLFFFGVVPVATAVMLIAGGLFVAAVCGVATCP